MLAPLHLPQATAPLPRAAVASPPLPHSTSWATTVIEVQGRPSLPPPTALLGIHCPEWASAHHHCSASTALSGRRHCRPITTASSELPCSTDWATAGSTTLDVGRQPPGPPMQGTLAIGPPLTPPRGHHCWPLSPRWATSSPWGHRCPPTSTPLWTAARPQSSQILFFEYEIWMLDWISFIWMLEENWFDLNVWINCFDLFSI
jgi:hypothetical protein